MATTPIPPPATAPVQSVHGPYEDAIIEGIGLLKDIVDGMSPDQRVAVWQGWIDFWKSIGIK